MLAEQENVSKKNTLPTVLSLIDLSTLIPFMYQAYLSEKIQFLRNIELFKKLLPTNIEKIAQVMELKTYNLGDKLITQGDAGDAFYMMQSGNEKFVCALHSSQI